MHIYIVRHGETDYNKKRIIQGKLNIDLNETGVLQARNIAERLKEKEFSKIYSSDLNRCRDTAKEIAKYHKTTIIYDKRLRERDFGIFNGKKGEDVDWNSLEGEFIYQKPSGGESLSELIIRVKSFLDEVVMKEDKNILLVTHSGTIKAVLNTFFAKNMEELVRTEKPRNTTLYIIERIGEKYSLVLENCDVHNN